MTSTKRPAPPQDRPSQNLTSAFHATAYRPEDGYQAPAVEDRADAVFEAEAKARGYRLALRCVDCGHFIVAEASVRRLRGPKCAARAEAVVADV